MRQYEECFTGSDAVTWLHEYLKASGTFGTVSKDQVDSLNNSVNSKTISLLWWCNIVRNASGCAYRVK